MLISATLPTARARLVTLAVEAPVIEAAKLLSMPDTHLLVVCNPGGVMSDVLTKADIVRRISHCTGCSCTQGVAGIMTGGVVACRAYGARNHLQMNFVSRPSGRASDL